MEEKWIRWEPIPNLAEKYYVESIIDNTDGLKILLSNNNNSEERVLVSFPDTLRSYRTTCESFLVRTIEDLEENYGSKFYGEWTFFKVRNSKYLDWLKNESEGISEDYLMKHFCLLTIDAMIDIATGSEPTVEHLK